LIWDHARYDIVHLSLGGFYLLLGLVCAVNIIRIVLRRQDNPSHHQAQRTGSRTWSLFFYPLCFVGAIFRAAFFAIQPLIMERIITLASSINYVMNTLPSFIFFATYLIILFRWAEIYHNSYEISSVKYQHLQTVLLWIIVCMFSILLILYCADFFIFPTTHSDVSQVENPIEIAIMGYDIALFLVTSFGFVYYGVSLSRKINQLPTYSNALMVYCIRIQRFTAFVCFVFIVRTILLIYMLLFRRDISVFWWFDGIYYFGLEVLPLVIMMYILRMKIKGNRKLHHPTSTTPLINNSV